MSERRLWRESSLIMFPRVFARILSSTSWVHDSTVRNSTSHVAILTHGIFKCNLRGFTGFRETKYATPHKTGTSQIPLCSGSLQAYSFVLMNNYRTVEYSWRNVPTDGGWGWSKPHCPTQPPTSPPPRLGPVTYVRKSATPEASGPIDTNVRE